MRRPRLLWAALCTPLVVALSVMPLWAVAVALNANIPKAMSSAEIATRFAPLGCVVFAMALILATAAEILVGLPLFFIFRRLGRLSLPTFLFGGLVAAIAGCAFVMWLDTWYLPYSFFGYSIPGLVGGLAFGYVGGWLPVASVRSDSEHYLFPELRSTNH